MAARGQAYRAEGEGAEGGRKDRKRAGQAGRRVLRRRRGRGRRWGRGRRRSRGRVAVDGTSRLRLRLAVCPRLLRDKEWTVSVYVLARGRAHGSRSAPDATRDLDLIGGHARLRRRPFLSRPRALPRLGTAWRCAGRRARRVRAASRRAISTHSSAAVGAPVRAAGESLGRVRPSRRETGDGNGPGTALAARISLRFQPGSPPD